MEYQLKFEFENAISRTQELLDSRILWNEIGALHYNSVFIEVLINLKDLLKKSEKHLTKVDFKDDVLADDKLRIYDVTDLISNFRDAACHNDSFRRKYGSMVSSFNIAIGKGVHMQIGDKIIESNYEDEVMFIMGINSLYLKRHIERAFVEIKTRYNNA
jgi:hypothetical protein